MKINDPEDGLPRVSFPEELSSILSADSLFPCLRAMSASPQSEGTEADDRSASRRLAELILQYPTPLDAVRDIEKIISYLIASLDGWLYEEIAPSVFAARDVLISESAEIIGPTVIMPHAEIRHCAYIRGKAIIGRGAVVGNSSEVKSSILLDGAKLPHFNYVGDSIIGAHAHLGAGAVTSNLRSDKGEVTIKYKSIKYPTSMRKLGALVGDEAEIGCGAVLNPGSIITPHKIIYPNSSHVGVK